MPCLWYAYYFITCHVSIWYVTTCHVITSDLSVTCYYLTYVYHLATDLLSSTTWHAIIWQDPLVMTWLATRLLSISCHELPPDYYQSLAMTCYQTIINLLTWLVTWCISPLIMLSLDTKHDTLDSYNYHDNGNVVSDLQLWFLLWFQLWSCSFP